MWVRFVKKCAFVGLKNSLVHGLNLLGPTHVRVEYVFKFTSIIAVPQLESLDLTTTTQFIDILSLS